jgi:hypothetical protein
MRLALHRGGDGSFRAHCYAAQARTRAPAQISSPVSRIGIAGNNQLTLLRAESSKKELKGIGAES